MFFLLVWGLHLATLHPAFQTDDSPEVSAAAAGLGIAHPPGYPLPTLLGRLATRALPGAVPFTVNALAAFWASLGALLGLLLASRALGRSRQDWPWLALAALGLATLPQLWFQGQSSKGGIYTLNLCLTLAPLLLVQPSKGSVIGRGPGLPIPQLGFAWLLFGLGLAGHYMSLVLFLPALATWSWMARPGLRAQAKLWLLSLPGIALYLYLPIRAGFHPFINWGNPDQFGRLMDVLLRRMYSGAESGQDLGNALHLGRHFLRLWQAQWSWPLLAVLALGIKPLWQEGARWRPLLLTLALHLIVVLAYNHPPQGSPWVINAFFLPTFVLSLPPILAGARRIQASLGERLAPWLPLLPALVLLWLAPQRYRQNDYHRDYLLYDYAQDLLLVPAPGSLLLAAGGNDAFGVWYLQQQEARRRDLVLLDVPLIGGWYLDQVRPQLPELDPAWRSRDAIVQGLLAKPGRPLYYSSHNPGDRGIPLGLVSWVPQRGQALSLSVGGLLAPWAATRLRWAADLISPLDENRRELLAYYPDSAQALLDFAQAQRVQPLIAPAQALEARLRRASLARDKPGPAGL